MSPEPTRQMGVDHRDEIYRSLVNEARNAWKRWLPIQEDGPEDPVLRMLFGAFSVQLARLDEKIDDLRELAVDSLAEILFPESRRPVPALTWVSLSVKKRREILLHEEGIMMREESGGQSFLPVESGTAYPLTLDLQSPGRQVEPPSPGEGKTVLQEGESELLVGIDTVGDNRGDLKGGRVALLPEDPKEEGPLEDLRNACWEILWQRPDGAVNGRRIHPLDREHLFRRLNGESGESTSRGPGGEGFLPPPMLLFELPAQAFSMESRFVPAILGHTPGVRASPLWLVARLGRKTRKPVKLQAWPNVFVYGGLEKHTDSGIRIQTDPIKSLPKMATISTPEGKMFFSILTLTDGDGNNYLYAASGEPGTYWTFNDADPVDNTLLQRMIIRPHGELQGGMVVSMRMDMLVAPEPSDSYLGLKYLGRDSSVKGMQVSRVKPGRKALVSDEWRERVRDIFLHRHRPVSRQDMESLIKRLFPVVREVIFEHLRYPIRSPDRFSPGYKILVMAEGVQNGSVEAADLEKRIYQEVAGHQPINGPTPVVEVREWR